MPSDSHPLFRPLRVGNVDLQHRIAMAPMGRLRANDDHTPSDLAVTYYAQRASTPGTLLISESTPIDASAGGRLNQPGIWSDDQAVAWKQVVDAVHAKGSFIFLQLTAFGRVVNPKVLEELSPGADVVSSGDIPYSDVAPKPRPLTTAEIEEYLSWYVRAAKYAVETAGFDGVEIQGANGYLVDQFIQDTANNRTDEYGGSVENRIRFPLCIVQSLCDAVGPSRVAIRLSPFNRANGMRMTDPAPTYVALVRNLAQFDLAYIHLSAAGLEVEHPGGGLDGSELLRFLRDIWAPRPVLLNGLYTPENVRRGVVDAEESGENIVVAFGRWFISNPDLPVRLRDGLPLAAYDRSTFYTPKSPRGYIDYPFHGQE